MLRLTCLSTPPHTKEMEVTKFAVSSALFAPHSEKIAIFIEHPDAVSTDFAHVDIVLCVDGQSTEHRELTRSRASLAQVLLNFPSCAHTETRSFFRLTT